MQKEFERAKPHQEDHLAVNSSETSEIQNRISSLTQEMFNLGLYTNEPIQWEVIKIYVKCFMQKLFEESVKSRQEEFDHLVEIKKNNLSETSEIRDRVSSLIRKMFDQGPDTNSPIQWEKIKWLVDNFNCGNQALIAYFDDARHKSFFETDVISHLKDIFKLDNHQPFMMLLEERLIGILYEGMIDEIISHTYNDVYLTYQLDPNHATKKYIQCTQQLMNKLTPSELAGCINKIIHFDKKYICEYPYKLIECVINY